MKTIALYRDKNPIYLNADIETQKKSCREFAKAHNIEFVHEYVGKAWDIDDAAQYSADALAEIKEIAKSGKVDTLLVYSFYCIGREDVETPVAIQALLKMGIQVLSVMEGSFV